MSELRDDISLFTKQEKSEIVNDVKARLLAGASFTKEAATMCIDSMIAENKYNATEKVIWEICKEFFGKRSNK